MANKMWVKLFLTIPFVLSAAALGGTNLINRDMIAATPPAHVAQHSSVGASTMEPETLYHKVWQLIHEDYYDQTYNQQSWGRWEHRYDNKLKTMDDAHKGIESMLASLGD